MHSERIPRPALVRDCGVSERILILSKSPYIWEIPCSLLQGASIRISP